MAPDSPEFLFPAQPTRFPLEADISKFRIENSKFRSGLLCLVVFPPYLIHFDFRFWKAHVKAAHRFGDDIGDDQVARPFAVRRDDEPRRDIGAAFRQSVLKGIGVGVPEVPLRVISIADLPILPRVVDSLFETF